MRRALVAAVALGLIALWLPRAESHLPPRPGRPCPGETDAVQTSGQWETIKAPRAPKAPDVPPDLMEVLKASLDEVKAASR